MVRPSRWSVDRFGISRGWLGVLGDPTDELESHEPWTRGSSSYRRASLSWAYGSPLMLAARPCTGDNPGWLGTADPPRTEENGSCYPGGSPGRESPQFSPPTSRRASLIWTGVRGCSPPGHARVRTPGGLAPPTSPRTEKTDLVTRAAARAGNHISAHMPVFLGAKGKRAPSTSHPC